MGGFNSVVVVDAGGGCSGDRGVTGDGFFLSVVSSSGCLLIIGDSFSFSLMTSLCSGCTSSEVGSTGRPACSISACNAAPAGRLAAAVVVVVGLSSLAIGASLGFSRGINFSIADSRFFVSSCA